MQIQEIKELMDKMCQTGLSLLELEAEGYRLCLRRESWSAPLQLESLHLLQDQHVQPNLGRIRPEAEPEELAVEELPGLIVTSPAVGIFYAAPSPDSDPFVRVGSVVEGGSPLCIIEAMKLMNEVTSPCDGVILQIMAENGQRVEFGQPLMRIGGE